MADDLTTIAELLKEIRDLLKPFGSVTLAPPEERPPVAVPPPFTIPIPLDVREVSRVNVGNLIWETGSTSTTSSAYVSLIDVTVPRGEVYDPWIVMIGCGSGELVANFRIKLGDLYQVVDFNPKMRGPIYFPILERISLGEGKKIEVSVKSDGSTTVDAFAAVIGARVF